LIEANALPLSQTANHATMQHSIATMALSCIVSEIKRDIGRKSQLFYIPFQHKTSHPFNNLPGNMVADIFVGFFTSEPD